jgi:hypothetical protein
MSIEMSEESRMHDYRARIVPCETWANGACPVVSMEDMRRAFRKLEELRVEQTRRNIFVFAELAEVYGQDAFLPVDQWPLGCIALNMASENGRRLAMAIQERIDTPDFISRVLMPPAPIPFPPAPPRPGAAST